MEMVRRSFWIQTLVMVVWLMPWLHGEATAAVGVTSVSLDEIRTYLQIPARVSDEDLNLVLSLQVDVNSAYREVAEYMISQGELVKYYLSGKYLDAINNAYVINSQFGEIGNLLDILLWVAEKGGYTMVTSVFEIADLIGDAVKAYIIINTYQDILMERVISHYLELCDPCPEDDMDAWELVLAGDEFSLGKLNGDELQAIHNTCIQAWFSVNEPDATAEVARLLGVQITAIADEYSGYRSGAGLGVVVDEFGTVIIGNNLDHPIRNVFLLNEISGFPDETSDVIDLLGSGATMVTTLGEIDDIHEVDKLVFDFDFYGQEITDFRVDFPLVLSDVMPLITVTNQNTHDYAPKPVTLSASYSILTAGVSIETYLWQFGDGNSSSTATPTYIYTEPGDYPVTLTLGLNSGGNATAEKIVHVLNPVHATFSYTPEEPIMEAPVSFDASGSSDALGAMIDYSWDFGDGSPIAHGALVEHTYPYSGGYTVVLDVIGSSGNTDTSGWQIFVLNPSPEDNALFVADVTIPDGTEVSTGLSFTKVWRLQNVGNTTWDATYALAFNGGEQMGSPNLVPLGQDVPPQGTVDISVNMVAPSVAGTYRNFQKNKSSKSESSAGA